MKNRIQALKNLNLPAWAEPLVILLVCVLAYGLVIPWLGFYWDDWAFLFIRTQLGAEGLTRYFATNRPFIAWIPQVTIPLLGTTPWKWHVFMLLVRASSAVSVWWVIRLAWQEKRSIALWTALLFAVYPGFDQQPIAINYSDFFLLFTFLMLSFGLGILAVRSPRKKWWLLLIALPLAAYNHLALEYFFLLEFLRPMLMWFNLQDQGYSSRARLKRVLLGWAPFLLVWVGALVWRFFIFDYQTNNYEIGLLDQLHSAPLTAVGTLLLTIITDLFKVTLGAWALPFSFPAPAQFGLRSTLLYSGVILLVMLAALAAAAWQRKDNAESKPRSTFVPILTGLFAMLIAGWPFWLTSLPVGLSFAASRFTLPFILGVSLFLAGLVRLLPVGCRVQHAILAGLVALAAGYQVIVATEYRRDWNTQKNFLWQMTWRAPAIEPGTVIVANDTPIRFASDNSLVSPLNWMYAPDNHSARLDYMFFYPSIRLETALKNLEPGMPIEKDYLAAAFKGSTDQLVALVYSPPGCLRVLDPDLDPLNQMLPLLIRQAAGLSKVDLIQPDSAQAAVPMPEIFGSEPLHGWCYYFEKADLARQQGDWELVAELGDAAYNQGDYPNDPTERLVFIEGYARTGQWQKAQQQTQEAAAVTPLLQPVLCRLWERIGQDTGSSIPAGLLDEIRQGLECTDNP
jgi:hypothetical protein